MAGKYLSSQAIVSTSEGTENDEKHRKSGEMDPKRKNVGDEDNDEAEPPLDTSEILLSMFRGVDLDKEKFRKKTKAEEEWEWQMKCTQDWFIRSSWVNKYLFLEALCKVSGSTVLETLIRTTELIFSKDVINSRCKGTTNFLYDKIPLDDNRALRPADLKKTIEKDFSWFAILPTANQISVILRLLKLGGGALIFFVYKKAKRMYEERQCYSSFLSLARGTLEETRDRYRLRAAKSSRFRLSFDVAGKSVEMKEFTKKKLEEIARRGDELTRYKKTKDIFEGELKNSKKADAKEVIDYLQILPMNLNRKIMSYLDEKTLSGLKKVGKYWGKMIDESINEISGRKAINAKINKVIRSKSYAEPEEYDEEQNEMDGEEAEEAGEGDEEKEEKWERVKELGSKKLLTDKHKNERALLLVANKYKSILSQKCETITMDSSNISDRICCLDCKMETLACTTPNNFVHFYSVRTGAILKFFLFAFESLVTCIKFHEDRIHIFVGLKDGSLLGKDFRTNKTRISFKGHSQSIKFLFTTSLNLLSSSSDNTIKYFQLWSGVCLLCIDLNTEFNISSLLMRCDKPNCCIVGTNEGVLISIDLEMKCFLNKTKLYKEPIKFLAQCEDLLITATKLGKIRVWNLKKFETNVASVTPYYNLITDSDLTCLAIHQSQIFICLDNGNLKIISLANGNVFLSLHILEKKISGLALTEDKFNLKVIIWSEDGIEMKTFPLLDSSFNKKSIKKLKRRNTKEEQWAKAVPEYKMPSDPSLARLVKYNTRLNDPFKYITFRRPKKQFPMSERCCTGVAARKKQTKPSESFKTDIFTEIVNENHLLPTRNHYVQTFSRYKYKSS